MFQLVDDQLDFTGEAEALGKPIGGDLLEGKMTLPLIHLRDHAGPDAVALIRRIVRDQHATPEDWARLRQHDGRPPLARVRADPGHRLRRGAKRQLAVFPDRPERDALMALADYVVSRDR